MKENENIIKSERIIKVIIISPELPLALNHIKGGVQSATINLLHGFKSKNIKIKVLVPSREVKEIKIIEFDTNIEIHYFPEGPFRIHTMNFIFSCTRIINKYIREIKPDIIHYETGNSFLLTKLFGIKGIEYLQTIHGMAFDEAKSKTSKKDKLIWYFNGLIQIMLMPKKIIHLSNFSKNKYSKYKIEKNKIIPNAIKSNFFDLKIKNQTDNILLYIGVINNNKNLIHILKSIKELKENNIFYSINIVGDFIDLNYKNKILEYVNENNLLQLVKFHGWLEEKELLTVIEKSDILIVASNHESLPMSIAECMAAGKVIVASRVGGIPEMIDNYKTGYLFDNKSKEELNNILKKLHDNDNEIKSMIKNTKENAYQKYHCDIVAIKTMNFYSECINK